MAEQFQPVETDQRQAFRFHSRERRRSLAGIVDLSRTHYLFNSPRELNVSGVTAATPIVVSTFAAHGLVDGMTVNVIEVQGVPEANTETTVTVLTPTTFELDGTIGTGGYTKGGTVQVFADMPVPSIDTGTIFPARLSPITFTTAIRITGAAPLGMVFSFGSSSRGCGLGINDRFVAFSAGGSTAGENGFALFNNVVTLPIGLELGLVASVNPGNGKVRVWANGNEIVRAVASSGDFNGDWADTTAGAFAAVPPVSPPPGLGTMNQSPVDFEVIEPLSVYVGQIPRQFY